MNAALLGLLIATPACSFVSCKDYDEDFKKVNNRLDDLAAAKAQIEKEIQSNKTALETANKKAQELEGKLGSFATKTELEAANKKAQELEGKLGSFATKTELEAAKENLKKELASASALEVQVKALQDAKKLIDDNKASVDELKTKLSAIGSGAVDFLKSAKLDEIAALPQKLSNQQDALDGYKKRLGDVEQNLGTVKIAELKEDLKKLQDAGYQTKEQVDAALAAAVKKFQEEKLPNELNLLLTAQVSSLHYIPEFYAGGIESLRQAVFEYNLFKLADAADEKGVAVFTKDVEADGQEQPSLSYAEANYQVNPSTAKVVLDKANFSFNPLRRATRAAEAEEKENLLEVVGTPTLKDGVLTVGFKSDLPEEENNEVNVFSLSYTAPVAEGKTASTVTSDFARVVEDVYGNLQIGKVDEEANLSKKLANPLFKGDVNTATALKEDREKRLTFKVAHSGEGFSLPENVATYGDVSEKENNPVWEQLDKNAATDSYLKKAGFHYEYALVKDGKDDTSVDAFEFDKATGVIKAKQVKGAPYANVGKVAVVRVTLLDNQNRVASVGYFNVKVDLKATVLAELKIDNALPYNCDKEAVLPPLKFSLKALNEKLATDYKDEWNVWNANKQYAFRVVADKQFVIVDGVGKRVDSPKGTIEVNYIEDTYGTVTLSGLKRKDLVITKVGDTYETLLKVQKINDPDHHFFFVKLVWTPKEVQAAPVLKFTGVAIGNDWKKKVDSDEKEIRVHVALTAGNQFDHDLKGDFEKNTVKATLDPEYHTTYLDSDFSSAWKFLKPKHETAVGSNGVTYKLSVSDDGTKLYAQGVDKLTGDLGNLNVLASISAGGVIKVPNTYITQVLINQYAPSELKAGESLTARVAYQTTLCNGKTVLETIGENREFDVRFLRPLEIKNVVKVAFTDAEKQSQEAALNFDAIFKDWRNKEGNELKTTYGIDKVGFAPMSEWTTDLNGGNIETQKLVAKFGDRGLAFATTPTASTASVDRAKLYPGYKEFSFGGTYPKLQYTANSKNFSEFKVRIPVYFHYSWGEIKSYIEVTVKGTINQ